VRLRLIGIGLPFRPMTDWTQTLKALHARSLERYAGGNLDLATWFNPAESDFLASIGARPIHLFDYAEDLVRYGAPDWETALLLMAVRREYFLFEQRGRWSGAVVTADSLPPKTEAVEGIEWLPRIHVKARAYLEGAETPGIMFYCGGDRAFLGRHGLHGADFLKAVWRAGEDRESVIGFVRNGGSLTPAAAR